MASPFVMLTPVIGYLVSKAGDNAFQGRSLYCGLKNEAQNLHDKLLVFQNFVRDVEERQLYEEDNTLRNRLSLIRDIVCDVEDLFDTNEIEVESEKDGDQQRGMLTTTGNLKIMKKQVPKLLCLTFLKKTMKKYKLAKEIQSLCDRISKLAATCGDLERISTVPGDAVGTQRMKHSEVRALRRTNSSKNQDLVVGLEDDLETLVNELLDGRCDRKVISIYGAGGLGKTTTAKMLYQYKESFTCCAWVCVSQDYRIEELLRNMIKSFWPHADSRTINKLAIEDLERYVRHNLSQKCYLLVIDDVWERDVWKFIQNVLPEDRIGSRVIMTTRNKKVAEVVNGRHYAHNLRYLNSEESWELFSNKVFQNSDVVRRQDMTTEELNMAEKIVRKCKGLPLAIIVLGGLLSRNRVEDWNKKGKEIWENIEEEEPDDVSNLLALSFADLPRELKSCFLYISIFPEDTEIDVDTAISLFITERLITRNDGGRRLEEMCEDCLLELADRSMIQAKRSRHGKVLKSFRVHDLLRELATREAKREKFVYVYDETSNDNPFYSIRRIALHGGVDEVLKSRNPIPKTRSLVHTHRVTESSFVQEDIWKIMQRKFKLLRVLDMRSIHPKWCQQAAGGDKVDVLQKLVLLRYLALTIEPGRTYDFGRLSKLEVLLVSFLKEGNIEGTVIDIRSLILLRKFSIDQEEGVTILLSPDLLYLRSLENIHFSSWSKIDTGKWIHLRKLWIWDLFKENCSFDSFIGLKSLEELAVGVESFTSDSLTQLRHCPNLSDLTLSGTLTVFPEDASESFPNLVSLKLVFTRIEEDPMRSLGKFPRLKHLSLGLFSYAEPTIFCEANTFRRLQTLEILSLEGNGMVLDVDQGAMRTLEKIYVSRGTTVNAPGISAIEVTSGD